jgi:hypothetical protein
MEVPQPSAPVPHRRLSYPASSFRPISRTQSSAVHGTPHEKREKGLDSVPLSQLLLSKDFCPPDEKKKKEQNVPEKNEDEIEGESDFHDDDGEEANFQNVFSLDEEKLEKQGFQLQRKKVGVEFNETAPPRFGSSKKERAKRWTKEETELFFECLQMCGTDFSVISKFLPNRTRKMIVNKFHCEERKGSARFKEAMRNPAPIDLGKFAEVNSVEKADIIEDYTKNKDRILSGTPLRRRIQSRDDEDALSGDDDFVDVDEDDSIAPAKPADPPTTSETTSAQKTKSTEEEKHDDEVEGCDDFNFD